MDASYRGGRSEQVPKVDSIWAHKTLKPDLGPGQGVAVVITRTTNYGSNVTASTFRRPDCEHCGGLDCGTHPLDTERGFGERYVEPCAFSDLCACCGGDCAIDYTGEHQCRFADYEGTE